jgi:hypothetical protein
VSALATGRAGARRRHDERGRQRPGGRERSDAHAHAHDMTSLFDDVGGESTLDTLVSGAWEGLAAHKPVPCPVCGGEMTPDYGVHALPIGGCCQSCGTTFS